MMDSKTMISQVQEIQLILQEIHDEGMILSEDFQVACIIEKMPPGWKDFKNYLKYKQKEMGIEGLIVRLRIEEDNRGSKNVRANSLVAKANVVEHRQCSITMKYNIKEKGVHSDARAASTSPLVRLHL